jgi:hypothetical protein
MRMPRFCEAATDWRCRLLTAAHLRPPFRTVAWLAEPAAFWRIMRTPGTFSARVLGGAANSSGNIGPCWSISISSSGLHKGRETDRASKARDPVGTEASPSKRRFRRCGPPSSAVSDGGRLAVAAPPRWRVGLTGGKTKGGKQRGDRTFGLTTADGDGKDQRKTDKVWTGLLPPRRQIHRRLA